LRIFGVRLESRIIWSIDEPLPKNHSPSLMGILSDYDYICSRALG